LCGNWEALRGGQGRRGLTKNEKLDTHDGDRGNGGIVEGGKENGGYLRKHGA